VVIMLRAVVRFSAIGSGSQFGGKSGGPLLPREIPQLGQFDRHRERLSFPGYDTAHYLAPDYEPGYPEGNLSPTANRDLAALVSACHRKRIRVFIDAVMAFAKEEPY